MTSVATSLDASANPNADIKELTIEEKKTEESSVVE